MPKDMRIASKGASKQTMISVNLTIPQIPSVSFQVRSCEKQAFLLLSRRPVLQQTCERNTSKYTPFYRHTIFCIATNSSEIATDNTMSFRANLTRIPTSDLEDDPSSFESDPLAYESDRISYDSDGSSHESSPLLQRGRPAQHSLGERGTRRQCQCQWRFEHPVLFLLALLIVMLIGLYFVLWWVKDM